MENFNLTSLLIGFIVGCVASGLSYFIFIKFIKPKSISENQDVLEIADTLEKIKNTLGIKDDELGEDRLQKIITALGIGTQEPKLDQIKASLGIGDDKNKLTKIFEELQPIGEGVSDFKTNFSAFTKSFINIGERGKLGEIQLERILEMAGLQKGSYRRHKPIDGGIPDFIVDLPQNKSAIIDVKTPGANLEPIFKAIEEGNKQEELNAGKKFCEDVRDLITKLGDKYYNEGLENTEEDTSTPDYVFLYLPTDSMKITAHEYFDQLTNRQKKLKNNNIAETLDEFAIDRSIHIITPTTAVVVIKMIDLIWRDSAGKVELKNAKKSVEELWRMIIELVIQITKLHTPINDLRLIWNQGVEKKEELKKKIEDMTNDEDIALLGKPNLDEAKNALNKLEKTKRIPGDVEELDSS